MWYWMCIILRLLWRISCFPFFNRRAYFLKELSLYKIHSTYQMHTSSGSNQQLFPREHIDVNWCKQCLHFTSLPMNFPGGKASGRKDKSLKCQSWLTSNHFVNQVDAEREVSGWKGLCFGKRFFLYIYRKKHMKLLPTDTKKHQLSFKRVAVFWSLLPSRETHKNPFEKTIKENRNLIVFHFIVLHMVLYELWCVVECYFLRIGPILPRLVVLV